MFSKSLLTCALFALSGLSASAQLLMPMSSDSSVTPNGEYVLPILPYSPAALEPFLDEKTVKLHHDRHHAAYVKGANAASKLLREIALGKKDAALAPAATQALAFHLGGHVLHSLYWLSISPHPQSKPEGALADAITKSFGSYDGFLRVFKTVALKVKGSGWAVLGFDTTSQRLIVCSVSNHQNSMIPGFYPLIACDVWEHAYYLRYKNNRAAYIDAFIKQMDWSNANKSFKALK